MSSEFSLLKIGRLFLNYFFASLFFILLAGVLMRNGRSLLNACRNLSCHDALFLFDGGDWRILFPSSMFLLGPLEWKTFFSSETIKMLLHEKKKKIIDSVAKLQLSTQQRLTLYYSSYTVSYSATNLVC